MTPREAFFIATEWGPCDHTREIACKDPYYAMCYLINIDTKPTTQTWFAVRNTEHEDVYVDWCIQNFGLHPTKYLFGKKIIEAIISMKERTQ